MAELDDIREELALAREEIASLRIKATTTLSGTEFLTLLMVGPVIAAFVILGVIIVWKTTSNPDQVAPHLDIILVAFAIPAWAVRVNELAPEDGATVVHGIAKQFEWHTVYPGPDGRFGRRDLSLITSTNGIGLDRSDPNGADDIHTVNQLTLPVATPVIAYQSTMDVIHSFAITSMRVKQDAIPGVEIPVWWEPTVTGNYEINCSQLCGLGHYRMRGFVTVMSDEDYQSFLGEEGERLTAAD